MHFLPSQRTSEQLPSHSECGSGGLCGHLEELSHVAHLGSSQPAMHVQVPVAGAQVPWGGLQLPAGHRFGGGGGGPPPIAPTRGASARDRETSSNNSRHRRARPDLMSWLCLVPPSSGLCTPPHTSGRGIGQAGRGSNLAAGRGELSTRACPASRPPPSSRARHGQSEAGGAAAAVGCRLSEATLAGASAPPG